MHFCENHRDPKDHPDESMSLQAWHQQTIETSSSNHHASASQTPSTILFLASSNVQEDNLEKGSQTFRSHHTTRLHARNAHTHNIPPYPARPNSHPCTSKQLKKTNTRTQRPATSSKRINPPKQPVHANHGGKRVLRCMVSLSDQRGLQQRTCSASASGSWYRKPSPGCSPHNFQPRVRKAARPSPSSRKQGRHGWQGLDGGRPIKLIDFGFSVVGQPIEPEPLRLLFQESPTPT